MSAIYDGTNGSQMMPIQPDSITVNGDLPGIPPLTLAPNSLLPMNPIQNLNTGTWQTLKQLWQKNWDCVANIGWPVLSNDLNPFSPGLGTASDVASQASQANLMAAGAYSVQRGLTVPLRSSAVRSAVTSSEALGKLSFILTVAQIGAAAVHADIAEHNGCSF